MSVEIERKFLVRDLPEDLADWPSESIDQGYLAITPELEVRIRRKGERHFLTVKSAPQLVRVEEEIEIDAERFANLWPLTEGRRVVKRRHARRDPGGPLLELDVYEGALAGLATVEVEFDDEQAARRYTPPAWVAEELTGDARFSNQNLALHGIPA